MAHGRRRSLFLLAIVAMATLSVASPIAVSAYEGDQSCIDARAALQKAKQHAATARQRVTDAKAALEKAIRHGKPRSVIHARHAKLRASRAELAAAKKAAATARDDRDAACAPPPAGGLYVSLGDSVAAGVGASSDANGFVPRLYAHYQASLGVTQLSNRAVGGATSDSLRSGGQLTSALADINGPSDTRVVTIDIGGNDIGGCPDWSASSCAFRSNFLATLADLKSALAGDPGDEMLIAMVYYNPGSGTAREPSYDTELLGANHTLGCADAGTNLGLNDVIAQVAAAHGALVANPYPAFKTAGQSDVAPDGIHPNDAGHAAIADAFQAASSICP